MLAEDHDGYGADVVRNVTRMWQDLYIEGRTISDQPKDRKSVRARG